MNMKAMILTGVVLIGFARSAIGQSPEMSLVVTGGGTTINAGQRITLEVFVGDVSPSLLRAYQTTLQIVPGIGTTGTLALAGPEPADFIFVDTNRTDWVFFGESAFPGINVEELRIAATMIFGGVEVMVPEYCGTYVFEASLDALGDFTIEYVLIAPISLVTATFLTDPNAALITSSFVPVGGVTVTVLPPSIEPPNNDCVDAFTVFGGTTGFTTADGTTDGPDLPVSCDEGNGTAIEQDVWFEHTATCSGVLTVSTCDDADFDTRIAVYGNGTSTCTCPTDNTDFLECNDDAAGCVSGTSEVALPVTAGICYTIRVGGVGAAEGDGNITITCAPDLCGNAEPLALNSTAFGSTSNTTVNDAIGPDCGLGAVDSPGVWYSATGNGNVMTASLCGGASHDTRLTVYEGWCGALVCVAEADNTCGNQESVSWCSTSGTSYLILVHGVGGAEGDFALSVSDQSCSDANACTDDACAGGVCTHQENFDATDDCCDPSDATVTTINDGNPCTDDACNALTGVVTHAARPNGAEEACTDLNPCTLDECNGGSCVNIDINSLPCASDGDCVGDATCEIDGFCECIGATLELIADPGALSVAGCHAAGGQIVVRVELGPPGVENIVPVGREIIGAQFFLSYDSSTLSVISVQPGSVLGTGSPFTTELNEQVDPVAGTIDYLVSISFGQIGTRVPGTVALITFQAMAECTSSLTYRLAGPNGEPNLLVTNGGGDLEPALIDLGTLSIDADPPVLSPCPDDFNLSPDPGGFTAIATWATPTATDTCDAGQIEVVCDPPSGSAFDAGSTLVTCTAQDSCGLEDECAFTVSVEQATLTVDVELSPTMATGPFERCLTFDLWDCDGPPDAQHATIQETLTFVSGLSTVVLLDIPGGAWECISARDELHTLSATAGDLSTVDGINFTASFVGNPASGGHWLLGGNLNDDDFIDIRDFGIFFPFFLTVSSADTICGVLPPHANINGDGVIDLLDLVFVSGNSLQASEPPCCGAGGAATTEGPIMSITVAELRRNKQFGMIAADVNHDGVLDINDIISVISGDIPPTPTPGAVRDLVPVKVGRPSTPETIRR